jgi:membrane-bound PQQ-dependent dehydrogenase (glucose/quinate/shikimate family)
MKSLSADWRRPVSALVLTLLGVAFTAGGAYLAALGGSTYYVLLGLALLAAAVLAWRGKGAAAWLYACITLATIVWAIAESGLDPWALMPRILAPAVLGLWFTLPGVRRDLGLSRLAGAAALALFVAVLLLLGASYVGTRFEEPPTRFADVSAPLPASGRDAAAGTDWTDYGGNPFGQRFTTSAQIMPANASALKPAWTYRTGDHLTAEEVGHTSTSFEATPLKIGDALYFCTGHNLLISLDVDTGRELWRYDPKADTRGIPHLGCRGVAYHRAAGSGACAGRIFMGTVDDRLLAVDSETGEPCTDFGTAGSVDLKAGIGGALPGYHYVTSPPTIIDDIAVIGSLVFDNQSNDEPSGVVRGFDVRTGELRWAWDVLQPLAHPALAKDESYPRDSPNAWAVFSADAALGLVYVPTGNSPPDYFTGARTEAQDRYSSSIVALDVKTGNVRWSFQTVHHDMWDYDVGSQPVLVDLDTPAGPVQALIAPTKRGEIFVLDRRTGAPIFNVEEKPVPQGPVAGDRLAATQPFSAFASFAKPNLTEAAMWGTTPLDQLWCRLQYRESRYDGPFTPMSTAGSLIYPSSFGVIDWGSVSIDPERQLMIVNTNNMVNRITLIDRRVADALGVIPLNEPRPADKPLKPAGRDLYAQAGTPYAVRALAMVSPLGFPCNQPPWGEIAAVDLRTSKILWQRPLGTSRDVAPLGLRLPVGVFSQGGAVTTRGGVTFIAGTIDDYLRAFDMATGRELWRGRLPAGGQATPMSYVSGRTGRQYVVIAAGGHTPLQTRLGDYVMAFALPH